MLREAGSRSCDFSLFSGSLRCASDMYGMSPRTRSNVMNAGSESDQTDPRLPPKAVDGVRPPGSARTSGASSLKNPRRSRRLIPRWMIRYTLASLGCFVAFVVAYEVRSAIVGAAKTSDAAGRPLTASLVADRAPLQTPSPPAPALVEPALPAPIPPPSPPKPAASELCEVER